MPKERLGFPCGSAGKTSVCNAGDLGSIPGLEKSPEAGKGYPLQYFGLENSMDSPWGHKESDTTERGKKKERLKTQHRKCHWILRMLFLCLDPILIMLYDCKESQNCVTCSLPLVSDEETLE